MHFRIEETIGSYHLVDSRDMCWGLVCDTLHEAECWRNALEAVYAAGWNARSTHDRATEVERAMALADLPPECRGVLSPAELLEMEREARR